MPIERDGSDTLAGAAQSSRPPYNRSNTSNTGNGSDTQVSQSQNHHHHHHQQQQQYHQAQPSQSTQATHRSKHQKRVVGGGAGRFHARVPSSKGLQKSHNQSTTKLKSRASSPEPDRPAQFANAHRRTTSDLKLTAVSNTNHTSNSSSNSHSQSPAQAPLRKNTSHSNLPSKPSRPRPDIGKRSKSAAVIKRSSSHKDVQKLKSQKNQVHFDLGNDDDDGTGNEDEWVDASASASPYLSRRGSVVSGGQSPAKPPSPIDNDSRPHSAPNADDRSSDHDDDDSPSRQTARHNSYITSRLLQRTPLHGAPPQMSAQTVSVPPPSGSPTSQASRGPSSLYGTPKTSTLGASGPEELISRFVNGSGPSSGGRGDPDSYFVPTHAPLRRDDGGIRRPQSLGNLNQPSHDSTSEDDERALAPRSKNSIHKAPPASQSRTQQKLNLQRASSTIEPAQAGPGVGGVGPSLLVGSSDYEHRDPRISRLVERTGMEYLVVRRYQNPIARSIARLSHLPGASNNRRIPKQNGTNGANTHGKNSLENDGAGRLGLSQSMTHLTRSRPTTPRRSTSIRTTGTRSSFEAHEERPHDRMSGSSYADGNDDNNLATLLRNLWDKSNDLGASQD
ncbi:hypothetical protein F5B22DRAFT_637832 [Xylaria bambusicola]|uniref:uncharacterized protein n=1 Tax=Xylaria bambusicola TaxID=326684 RepID=UPI00200836B9|nr:uncharacterized protein F5B22DRAFT_637832 [Xylaria bambusicola]KAI0509679.1 hypothetical protein F5B22DRAFT_637832 [Xylaria bambusicola]